MIRGALRSSDRAPQVTALDMVSQAPAADNRGAGSVLGCCTADWGAGGL